MSEISEYNKDYYAWLMRMSNLIIEKDFNSISQSDYRFICDEIESISRRVTRELDALLKHLMAFFLIAENRRLSDAWLTQGVIEGKRTEINNILFKSPSLISYISTCESLESGYPTAKLIAARLSDQIEESYPEKCPFTLEHILYDKIILMGYF
jgi:hypothetical protein